MALLSIQTFGVEVGVKFYILGSISGLRKESRVCQGLVIFQISYF